MSTALAQIDVGGSLRDGLSTVTTFVPKLLLFLVILLIGWLVARVLRRIIVKVLDKVGFEHAVERTGVSRALAGSRYDASGLIAAIVYYAILLIALQIAFGVFGGNAVSNVLAAIVGFLPKVIVAIIIVVIAAAVAQLVRDIVTSSLGGLSYGRLLANLASAFIIGLGVIAALNQMQIAVTVTTPVLIAVLATLGGVLVVGVGGGLVRPMQGRWERWLARAEAEAPQASAQAEAYQRGREDAGRHAGTPSSAGTAPGTGVPPAERVPTTGSPMPAAPAPMPPTSEQQPPPQP